MLSLHTSPVEQAGSGSAGGMNTYVLQTAHALARRGVDVALATGGHRPDVRQLAPRLRLHIVATTGTGDPDEVAGAAQRFGDALATAIPPCDVVHGHYWLSGLAAERLAARWTTTFVQSSHTLAAVKIRALGDPDAEPGRRVAAEAHLAQAADRLVANTAHEAAELVTECGADPDRVSVVEPGVDHRVFVASTDPDEAAATRVEFGLDPQAPAVAYVGRLQPLKGPDVLLRAAGPLVELLAAAGHPRRLTVVVCGAPAGPGPDEDHRLRQLAQQVPDGVRVRFLAPLPPAALARVYRALDIVAVPSRSESFGLVALEAQACGTPVVAAAVGGLPRAVAPDAGGLVPDHDPGRWAQALSRLLTDPAAAAAAARGASRHAARFSWDRTADGLLDAYAVAAAAARRT